jgi:hypothetical protein
MSSEPKKFSFNLNFKGDVDPSQLFYIRGFAEASTPEEAILNLAQILDGTRHYKQLGGKGYTLDSLALVSTGRKRVISFKAHVEMTKVSVNWGTARYDFVETAFWDALMKTFPEQTQIFKGKILEEAMGL